MVLEFSLSLQIVELDVIKVLEMSAGVNHRPPQSCGVWLGGLPVGARKA